MLPRTTDNLSGRPVSRSTVWRRARKGEYERVARGLYVPSGGPLPDLDLLEAAHRRPDAIICLTSALVIHDLSDEIPRALDLAIPRPSRIPVSQGALSWHVFDRATFDVGRLDYPVDGTDHRIGVYSPERSIVDALRLRGSVGYEPGIEALRLWLQRGGKPKELLTMAQLVPRSEGIVRRALELLG